jgi:hypothetical protein
MGLAAIGRYRLGGVIPVGSIYKASAKFGSMLAKRRKSDIASEAATPFPVLR